MNNFKAPGSNFLLFTGLMYVIFSILNLIVQLFTYILGFFSSLFISGIFGSFFFLIFGIFGFIGSIYGFVIGIIVITNRNNLQKSELLFKLSIIALILGILGIFNNPLFGSFNIILPILLLIGANKNKRAYFN